MAPGFPQTSNPNRAQPASPGHLAAVSCLELGDVTVILSAGVAFRGLKTEQFQLCDG